MALSKKELRNRWRTEDGKERLAKVVEALQEKRWREDILEGFPGVDEVENGRDFRGAGIEKGELKNAKLFEARLEGANIWGAHLEGADFSYANLEGAKLQGANLEGAYLSDAHLKGVDIWGANLKGAYLGGANLEDAKITNCNLTGARFFKPQINRKTDFRGSNIESMLCQHEILNHIKYNNRRLNWEDWYFSYQRDYHFYPSWHARVVGHVKDSLRWLAVRPFWWLTDYGTSTIRLFLTFFILAGVFAFWYWESPESISNLQVVHRDYVVASEFKEISVPLIPSFRVPIKFETQTAPVLEERVWLRAVYFSVVTMTTLGFGDIYAEPNSTRGYLLLMAQVILGYILLGALITRLGILFQSGGPTDIKK